MAMESDRLFKRPLLILALGLAATAVLCQALAPPVLGAIWLVLALGALTSGRAWSGRAGSKGPPQSRPRLWVLLALGLVAVTGLRAIPPLGQARAEGIFSSRWQARGRELGDLQGHGIAVQLPAGFVRDGDRVQIHGSAQQVLYAAPPFEQAAPHSWTADPGQIHRTRAAPFTIWKVPAAIHRLRAGLAQRLRRLEGEETRGLAQALLLGLSREVEPGIKDRFTRTGTRHLLALSGLHVGLMWWLMMRPICMGLARLLSMQIRGRGLQRRHQGRLGALLQVVALLFFLPILGGGTPALRATLALGLADCARQAMPGPGAASGSGRRVDPLSIWSLSLAMELLWQPTSITSISLQLSYAATLGLILFWAPCHAHVLAVWHRCAPTPHWGSNSLGKPRHAAWPWVLRVSSNYLVGGLLASVVATLSTLPFIWIHFGEWSPVGVIGTLILLPFVAAGLFLGWCYAALPWLVPTAWAAWPFEQIPIWLERLDTWTWTPHLLPERSPFLIAALFSMVSLALLLRKASHWRCANRIVQRLALGLGCALLLPSASPPSNMTVHVCDVGHGTTILVRMPCGRNWLFDAGSRDRKGVANRAILPLLRRYSIDALHVVISHGDRDHLAALARVASRVKVLSYTGPAPSLEFLDSVAVTRTGLDWDMGRGTLQSSSCRLKRCRSKILRGLDQHGNEGSRNLWVECDGRAVLLCGDAEDEGLTNILPHLDSKQSLAALLIPHHGSKQKNLGCLISHTRPEQVWFSASKRSPLAQSWPYMKTTTRWTARDGGWSEEFKPIKQWAGNLETTPP